MKATGIVRRIDDLGRIVIPSEVRKSLHIEAGDEIAMSVDSRTIRLNPVKASCFVCGDGHNLIEHKGVCVCGACLGDLVRAEERRGEA